VTNVYTLPDKNPVLRCLTFDPHLLAQFGQQIQKEQARNIESANFQTYNFQNEDSDPRGQKWDVAFKNLKAVKSKPLRILI